MSCVMRFVPMLSGSSGGKEALVVHNPVGIAMQLTPR